MRVISGLATAALATIIACGGQSSDGASVADESSTPRSLLELQQRQEQAESPLLAERDKHDFGDVPIDGGTVSTVFEVTNPGADPVRLVSVFTSCGCTTAEIEFPDSSTEGPFGMPGHSLPTGLDRTIGAGETLKVRVMFDPAAHGPEGLGRVMRTVTLHTADGAGLSLEIRANVVRG
jgi:hypothetical protein